MTTPEIRATDAALTEPTRAARDNIRGSTLLAVGRVIAVGINFLVHVMIVRYLSVADYGALAYALSFASLGSSVAVFGMNKTLARFVPIYEEEGDFGRMFGGIAFGLAIMASFATTIVLVFYLTQGLVADLIIDSDLAIGVLMIVVLMIPVQASDSALLGLFAIFGSARHIFWRRHIVGPLLSLATAAVVIIGDFGVLVLAGASVAAAAAGVLIYGVMLVRVMYRRGLFAHFHPTRLRFPIREMLSFSLPLLSTDVVAMLRGSVILLLLGSLAGVPEVALFSAVAPIANQNTLVLDSFRLLFTPAAARLYAREDREGINALYWRSTVWVVIATVPVLLVSVALAQPLAVFLFGDEYANAAIVLAILAIGNFTNSAFGHNGLTLRVYGRVRYLVTVDISTALVGVIATVPLIAMWGALGAAIGVMLIYSVQNVLYQLGLSRSTSVSGFAMQYLPVYIGIPVATGILLLAQLVFALPLWLGLAGAAVLSVAYLLINRRHLRLGEVFPEMRRVPLVRLLID